MRFDRFPRWTHRTLLAMTVGFVMVAACGPVAPDPQPEDVIQVDITAVGPGTVRHPSSGFVCRGDCIWAGSAEQATGFVAEADGANAFVAWTGVRHTLDATCAHLLEDGDATTATFAPHALRLHRTGDGEGEFRIQQGTTIDIGCTEDCAVGLPQPLSLAITHYGGPQDLLDDWGGACAGADRSDYCLVSVNGATDVSMTWRHPPVAVDDAYGTARNATLSVSGGQGVLANDDDTPEDVLTASLVAGADRGTVTVAPDGGFTYTPEPNYTGPDTFTYRARDAFGSVSNTATVTIAVTQVNRAPVANDDAYAVESETDLVVIAPGVLDNDSDPDGDPLTVSLGTDVANGTLDLQLDGSFTYTPNANYFGTDTFTYIASDGELASAPATVTITVTAVNDAPVAVDDAYGTAFETELVVDAPGVLDNDADPDGDTLTVTLGTDVANGTLDLQPDGSFTYTPDAAFSGNDTFTYTASDGVLTSAATTVTITVATEE
jgi:VCBS repeat-containing protein